MLKAAFIFTDNMVLQRNKNISVWGACSEGMTLECSLKDNDSVLSSDTCIANGSMFSLLLPSICAGGPYTLVLTGSHSDGTCEKQQFNDVMVGEVWLAGGQSNMEFELQNEKDGKRIISDINENKSAAPDVRFFYTPKIAYRDDNTESKMREAAWQVCGRDNISAWSGVAFHFAEKLSKEHNVTFGIIGCNWGGTSASAWIDQDLLKSNTYTSTYLEDFDKAMEGKTAEEHKQEYLDYLTYSESWNKRIDRCYKDNPDIEWTDALKLCGECKYPGPMGPCNEFRPSGLYDMMIKQVAPYSLRGFIYYQGESDDHRPEAYGKLFPMLIENWRRDWKDDTLPFLFVQLPMFKYRDDPDIDNWPVIREAQMKTYRTIKNTGIAVIADCGEFNNIHPLDKKPVGERLALQADCQVYKSITCKEAFGPVYSGYEYGADYMDIYFDYAEDGFITKTFNSSICRFTDARIKNYTNTINKKMNNGTVENVPLFDFEIAGSDGNYIQAEAEILKSPAGRWFIRVSSPNISKPVSCRYAWHKYSEIALFGANGLPVAPFTSDCL